MTDQELAQILASGSGTAENERRPRGLVFCSP